MKQRTITRKMIFCKGVTSPVIPRVDIIQPSPKVLAGKKVGQKVGQFIVGVGKDFKLCLIKNNFKQIF